MRLAASKPIPQFFARDSAVALVLALVLVKAMCTLSLRVWRKLSSQRVGDMSQRTLEHCDTLLYTVIAERERETLDLYLGSIQS